MTTCLGSENSHGYSPIADVSIPNGYISNQLIFHSFVMNAGVTRRRWEHAELECQRLGIELTKTSQVFIHTSF